MRAAFVALALLAGCMVGPDYVRPPAPEPREWGEIDPASLSRATTDPTSPDWWTTFNDPVLTSLIERAVMWNLDLQQAVSRVRQARAQKRITSAALWPSIGSSAAYSRNRTSGNVLSADPGRTFDLWQVGFDASWEIDVFGGNRRAVEAAEDDVEAARNDANEVLVTLLAEVGANYVQYRSLQQRIVLAQQNLASQQRTLDLTHKLFDAGLAAEFDVTRAASQVATTESTIPLLDQQAHQAMHQLSTLLGLLPMTLAEELAPVGQIPSGPAAVSIGMPSELLLRRPDVGRAERQLASITAQIGVARRDLFPRFFIMSFAGLESISASDFITWGSRQANIGPTISWPIFEGGRIFANIDLTEERHRELAAAYQAIVLQAFQEVEDALVAYSREQLRRADLTRAVQADQRTADLARQLYAQGLTDFLAVLDAERTLFTSEDTLAQSARDVALDLVALYKAVGGGWDAWDDAPVTASR
jgi:NodT family efflux transporter outer membrane factor (OMF) lipoprotein